MSERLRERLGPLVALAGLCLLFGGLAPRFFEVSNFVNVARQISTDAILAVGMTFIIVSGGIDLSVGSVLALSTCVSGLLMGSGVALVPALGAGLGTGLVCGGVTGLLIARAGISPFIASLGMMSFARGLAMVVTQGNPVANLDRRYFFLGTGSLLGVPVPVWVTAAVALAGGFVLARMRLGRYALAIGSNEEAVRLSGISVARYKVILYVMMGGVSALAGWIVSARVASADPSAGMLMELEAIAAAVIGGASLKGGRGSILGTVLGAAIIGVLNDGLVLLGISAFWQQVLVGVVIVAAVGVDQLKARRRASGDGIPRRALWALGAALLVAAVATVVVVRRLRAEGHARAIIAVLGKASGGEFWLAVKAGAEARGDELGADVVWQGTPQETDVAKQIDLFENLIQRRVDGIAVAPTDAQALTPLIKRGIEAGIPVIAIDSDVPARDRLAYVGTDNRAAGEAAGRKMVELLGGRGKVAILTGPLGAQNLRQRCDGFRAGVAGSRIELLAEQSDNGDRQKALTVSENLLSAHPDLAGFFADTAVGGPGVAQALLARGLAGKVKVVSFDTTPALLGYLEQGVVDGLVAQQPETMGAVAVELLVKLAKGEPIAGDVDTGVAIVTREGVRKQE